MAHPQLLRGLERIAAHRTIIFPLEGVLKVFGAFVPIAGLESDKPSNEVRPTVVRKLPIVRNGGFILPLCKVALGKHAPQVGGAIFLVPARDAENLRPIDNRSQLPDCCLKLALPKGLPALVDVPFGFEPRREVVRSARPANGKKHNNPQSNPSKHDAPPHTALIADR
jgi:hypothetical protein